MLQEDGAEQNTGPSNCYTPAIIMPFHHQLLSTLKPQVFLSWLSVSTKAQAFQDKVGSLLLKGAIASTFGIETFLLRFVTNGSLCQFNGSLYQFKVLCFSLLTAPMVFIRIFALVLTWAYQRGICLMRHQGNWLITSRHFFSLLVDQCCTTTVCKDLGIVVSLEKSDLELKHKFSI